VRCGGGGGGGGGGRAAPGAACAAMAAAAPSQHRSRPAAARSRQPTPPRLTRMQLIVALLAAAAAGPGRRRLEEPHMAGPPPVVPPVHCDPSAQPPQECPGVCVPRGRRASAHLASLLPPACRRPWLIPRCLVRRRSFRSQVRCPAPARACAHRGRRHRVLLRHRHLQAQLRQLRRRCQVRRRRRHRRGTCRPRLPTAARLCAIYAAQHDSKVRPHVTSAQGRRSLPSQTILAKRPISPHSARTIPARRGYPMHVPGRKAAARDVSHVCMAA
jgi:hypothetical protein